MNKDNDSRLKHPKQYGETITLPELIQRWGDNARLVNRLCFENELRPKLGSRWSTVKKERGKPPIFIFIKIPTDSEPFVSEDEQDAPRYKQLPDDVYFDFQDILNFEDKHSELKLSNVEFGSTILSDEEFVLCQRQKAVAQIKASRTSGEVSIDDLLEISITDLFDEIRPEDDFSRYFELFVWKGQLDREESRVKDAPYQDEGKRERRVGKIREKRKEIDWHLADCPCPIPYNTVELVKTPSLEYGEPELSSNDAKGLYPILKLLGKDWAAGEFALSLLSGSVRAFDKKQKENDLLKPILNISEWLKWHGNAEVFSGEMADIDEILLQFVYSEKDLTNFTPDFRYISFDQAKEMVSDQAGGEHHAEKFLKSEIKNSELIVWHPLVGAVSMEQSLNEERWQHCFFADWQLNRILQNEFGCSLGGNLDATEPIGKNDNNSGIKELAHTKWFREIWLVEGSPTGSPFFEKLKHYKGSEGSPILDWYYSSQNGPGVKLQTETGVNMHYPKSQIQKLASKFAKEHKQQKNVSSKK